MKHELKNPLQNVNKNNQKLFVCQIDLDFQISKFYYKKLSKMLPERDSTYKAIRDQWN